MSFSEFLAFAALLFFFCPRCISCDKQRPIYNIGHMVNSIEEIEGFLKKGSNAIELDVQFFPNGSVKEILHGSPCDCGRYCEATANLKDYMEYLRKITDPNIPGNYYKEMQLLFLDLKLYTSNDIIESGRDIARHILNYLWSENEDREQEIRVLFYFDNMDYKDAVLGLKSEFERQGQTSRLKDVGFDGGNTGDIPDIEKSFADLKIKNIWIGNGNTNCVSFIWPDTRLKQEIAIRDSSDDLIEKVYKWTIDLSYLMRDALTLGVDGMITNTPERLLVILKEPAFERYFRLATIEDNPFEKYVSE